MSLIGLISCVSTKKGYATEAKDLYASPLFLNSRKYAEIRLDKYYILSAKYGLLKPNDIIEPYEETLKNRSKSERIIWSQKVFQKLSKEISSEDKIVFLAGEKYREFFEKLLLQEGISFQTPLNKLSIGKQLQWYKNFTMYDDRLKDIDRLYELIEKLKNGIGFFPKLNCINGSEVLSHRGLYMFFEDDEYRTTSPFVKRVTRVGTHAVSKGSSATLWNRLRTHRGGIDLRGNHRSSIFRLHVGNSIINKRNIELPTWGLGQNASAEIKQKEIGLEKLVSKYIGNMSILWLNIADEPTKFSDRSYLEKNLIALLSSYNFKLDKSNYLWLGNYNQNLFIKNSSLWNVKYVDLKYDSRFLDIFEFYVNVTIGNKPISNKSMVPIDWHNLQSNDQQLNLFDDESN